jgi:hypothetical protein
MKSEINSNHEALSYRTKIKTGFQVSVFGPEGLLLGLKPMGGKQSGEISGFYMTRRILTPDTRNLKPFYI